MDIYYLLAIYPLMYNLHISMYVPDYNEAHFKEETGKKIDMRLDFLKFFSTACQT